MNMKRIFYLFHNRACNYNLFISDENDYDDDPQDLEIVLKHQKYSTRLYILLLIGIMI